MLSNTSGASGYDKRANRKESKSRPETETVSKDFQAGRTRPYTTFMRETSDRRDREALPSTKRARDGLSQFTNRERGEKMAKKHAISTEAVRSSHVPGDEIRRFLTRGEK